MMLKRNIKKNLGASAKKKFNDIFGFLGKNTWIFTVLFFGAVLITSIWIWWQCAYNPKPSIAVTTKIETEKEDFDDMKKETQEAITFLQEHRDNYNNSNKFGDQRELFVDILDESVIEKLNDIESAKTEETNKTKEVGDEEIITQEIEVPETVENEQISVPTKVSEELNLGN